MAQGETTDEVAETLDELVPRPWSTARRVALGGLVVGVGLAGWLLWTSGAVVAHLAAEPALGGDYEMGQVADGRVVDIAATVYIPIVNRGRYAATVSEWEPPETSGIDWDSQAEPLPVTLEPGERVELAISAQIDDCLDIDADGTSGLVVRAQTPLGLTSTHSLDLDVHGAAGGGPWLVTHGDESGVRSPHEPSWVYSVLQWPCHPEAQDDE